MHQRKNSKDCEECFDRHSVHPMHRRRQMPSGIPSRSESYRLGKKCYRTKRSELDGCCTALAPHRLSVKCKPYIDALSSNDAAPAAANDCLGPPGTLQDKVICPSGSGRETLSSPSAKNIHFPLRLTLHPNQRFSPECPVSVEGRIASRHERETGCGGRGSVRRVSGRRAG